ncbi:Developmental and secondary metabolism regulator veA [Colletotrichum sp. SAR 10_66]|nr:Developmental and secondary metabolism regulator veA [Colletotrichum sp. SAR 10_75]KAJ5004613.1 Developmental and secondary metabolism regulator veA [Colletotrichum sp. SAR 10_66]
MMFAAPPTSIEDISETRSLVERRTRGGSYFFYEMNVLQQPERARACGSGSKSAADRRPVDPPPVVQLKVAKGPTPNREDAKDVTMAYNGNFFLFAELAPARQIAHGRVQTPAATSSQTPVLTGMPVSGMAYLDRPSEAGYFLFPDLSVRHEGRYVLAFHLYEEIKNPEDRDHDSDPAEDDQPCFNWRMPVKSIPFSVYSAKKFPGLTESTHLSKTISEQGCRVRIRRDVRMRRREGKPAGNEFENSNPENEYRNSRRTQTPELRSNADPYRARSHAQPMAQPPPPSPTASYYSNQPSPYHQAPSHSYSSRPSSQYAPSNPPPTPHGSYDRRGSMMVPQSPSTHVPRDVDYMRRDSDPRRDSYSYPRMAPLADNSRSSVVLPPLSSLPAPPLPAHMLRGSDIIEASPNLPPPLELARAGSKRGYSDTFQDYQRPLYDGQRPSEPHHRAPMYGLRDAESMTYKRAGGTTVTKPNGSYSEQ